MEELKYICPVRQAQIDYEREEMQKKYQSQEWISAQREELDLQSELIC